MDPKTYFYDQGRVAANEKYAVMMRGNPAAPMAPKPAMAAPMPKPTAAPVAPAVPGSGAPQGMLGKVNHFMGSPLGSALGQGAAMTAIPMIADKLMNSGNQQQAPQGF